jgi:pyroglutamyl-peptidase
MARVLLTGFEPFGGSTVNPSQDAVRLAVAEPLRGVELSAAILPCRFDLVIDALWREVERVDPDVVVCAGEAGGRAEISVERVAVNLDDARAPDNAGAQPVDVPVVAGGPVAYFATLPVRECVATLRASGIPATVSMTAGSFVCNHVFYGLLHRAATLRPGRLRGGFIHVPYAPEQLPEGGQPTMAVTVTATALRAVAVTAAVRGGLLTETWQQMSR